MKGGVRNDNLLLQKNNGINKSENSDGEIVHYKCSYVGGIGEGEDIQINWETPAGKQGEVLFSCGNRHVKEDDNDFYLE